ncbi:hypothetical protein ACMG5L_24130 [Escherichia coli]|uniref:hypothetical protein n=1 Tax=Escherichia coli TaxID=562 RepID=UPI0039BFA3E3
MDTYYWYVGIGTILFVAAAFVAGFYLGRGSREIIVVDTGNNGTTTGIAECLIDSLRYIHHHGRGVPMNPGKIQRKFNELYGAWLRLPEDAQLDLFIEQSNTNYYFHFLNPHTQNTITIIVLPIGWITEGIDDASIKT